MRTAHEIATRFAPREAMAQAERAFLVGIGGAGMSGLAEMLLHRGMSVAGTDATDSATLRDLAAEGAQVRVGHSGEDLRPGDVLILTDAIDLKTSPEVARAAELGLPLLRRSQALGYLLREKKTLAVTGSHGKTTTTAMLGTILRQAGLDPTIVVGAPVPDLGGAVVEGHGDWAVVEACEAYDSLRDFDPAHVILLNLEPDHLDFHGTEAALREAVLRFLNRLPEGGKLVLTEDSGALSLAHEWGRASEVAPLWTGPLALPGEHNRANAGAAVTLARHLGAEEAAIAEALHGFRGARRRLELVGEERGIQVIDDYAHHPTEIAASLAALRERFPGRRLVVVYQPHLYSRTQGQEAAFARALGAADLAVLTDIYPAREAPLPGVSSLRIVEQMGPATRYVPSRHLLPREVAGLAREGDVVVGMGAGNIEAFAPAFLAELRRPAGWIAVIYGGDSAEREVSLHSGLAVQAALERLGRRSRLVDLTDLLLGRGDLGFLLGPDRPSLCFLAVHGTHAEDGAIQGLLEMLHLPYTSARLQSSAIAMDKALTKAVLERHGIRVPRGELVRPGETPTLVPPVVVKPNQQGSTVGLSFVSEAAQLPEALERAWVYGPALVEEWLQGMEISVPVLVDRALPAVEIVPATGRYDFEAKYTPGATDEVCPARLPAEVAQRADEVALAAHRALECRGLTRTDMIVVEGEPVVLEVNTIPGMTVTSLAPRSAAVAGLSFDQLVEAIVRDAD